MVVVLKKNNLTFWIGLLILYVSVFYFLDMLGVNFRDFILLSLGTFLLFFSYKQKIDFLKYVSMIFLVQGLVHTTLSVINITPLSYLDYSFVLLSLYSIGCFIISKNKILFRIFIILISVVLIRTISGMTLNTNIKYAYYLYIVTILLSLYFIIIREKTSYFFLVLPLFSYLFGTNNLIFGNNLINHISYKFINLGLLVLSALIILLISRIKTSEEDKNEQ